MLIKDSDSSNLSGMYAIVPEQVTQDERHTTSIFGSSLPPSYVRGGGLFLILLHNSLRRIIQS